MTVAMTRRTIHNAERPREGADWVVQQPLLKGRVRISIWQSRDSHKAPESATGEFVSMSQPHNHHEKAAGRAHRERLRLLILPKLRPGCRVPSSAFLGRLLGVSASAGYWHMRWVLEEAGVTTETRGTGMLRRVYVVALPAADAGRAAA